MRKAGKFKAKSCWRLISQEINPFVPATNSESEMRWRCRRKTDDASLIFLLGRPKLLGDFAFQLIELSQLLLFGSQDVGLDHPVDFLVGHQLFARGGCGAADGALLHRVEEDFHALLD